MSKEAFAGITRTEDGTITVIPLGDCNSQLSAKKALSKELILSETLAVCPASDIENLLRHFKGKANATSMTKYDSISRRR